MSRLRPFLPVALCLALLTLFTTLPVQSAAPPTPLGWGNDPVAVSLDRQLLDASKTDSRLMTNLTHLSDAIGPRLTGSPALVRANEWAAQVMRGYGLTNVRLEPWVIPEGWERGVAVARMVEPVAGRPIHIASMGWYPGTKGKIVGDVVFLKAEKAQDLEAYKGKLKNAIVLMAKPKQVPTLDQLGKPAAARSGRPERGAFGKRNFTEMRTFRRELSTFLEKEGVAAIFQDAGKPLGLLVTTGSWGGMGDPTGGGGDRASANNRLPTLFVAHNHYEMLYRLVARPEPVPTRIELEVQNKFIPGPIKVFNTVGEIRGSEKPDEFVVVGAHLDSWDLAQGTTDNGTGTCSILEAARIIARSGIKPKRTIRFALFTGEEQGLHGSKAYLQAHKDEQPRTSAALVHDTGTGRVRGVGAGGRMGLASIMARELVTLKELGVTDFETPSMGGSDHVSFSAAGIPGLMMVQDMSTYTYTHHTQADTLEAAKEPDLIHAAQVLAVTAVRIANLQGLLPRVPSRGR